MVVLPQGSVNVLDMFAGSYDMYDVPCPANVWLVIRCLPSYVFVRYTFPTKSSMLSRLCPLSYVYARVFSLSSGLVNGSGSGYIPSSDRSPLLPGLTRTLL